MEDLFFKISNKRLSANKFVAKLEFANDEGLSDLVNPGSFEYEIGSDFEVVSDALSFLFSGHDQDADYLTAQINKVLGQVIYRNAGLINGQ